jgi:predicted nucleotidyltransferase
MRDDWPDFPAILEALSGANVRYVLIGGLAMIAHGSAHVTSDIDVGYARDRANIGSAVRALQGLHPRLRGFPEDLPFVWDEQTLRSASNVTLATDAADLDMLGDIPGVDDFEGLWARSKEVELYGLKVRVASVDDLIAMKRAANRPKDQSHLLELYALKKLTEGGE